MKVIFNSSASSIEKEILVEGNFSKKPAEYSACSVIINDINIPASESIDEVFHSEYLKPPSTEMVITIGDANCKVDEHVERVIQTMFVNEESLVKITLLRFDDPSKKSVSFGFRMTLVGCDLCRPIWGWTAKEKYEVAMTYKEGGVILHKSMRIVDAFLKFSKACKILISLEPMEDHEMEETLRKDINDLRKVLYNNMAECHLIRKNYEHVISLCDKVLERDENNVKAFYRKAVANENLKDYEKALEFMEKVVILEPRNSVAKERLVIYRKKIEEAKKSYDNIVKKMFHVKE